MLDLDRCKISNGKGHSRVIGVGAGFAGPTAQGNETSSRQHWREIFRGRDGSQAQNERDGDNVDFANTNAGVCK